MVEFQTISSKDVTYKDGKKFIEVAKKKAVDESTENLFFSLAQGFFTPEGEKRYKKNFSIPADGKTLSAVIAALQELASAEGSSADEEGEIEIEGED